MIVMSPERYDFLVHSAERGHLSRRYVQIDGSGWAHRRMLIGPGAHQYARILSAGSTSDSAPQTSAARQICPGAAFLSSSTSCRASTAGSSPILLRNRKQSTTVRARGRDLRRHTLEFRVLHAVRERSRAEAGDADRQPFQRWDACLVGDRDPDVARFLGADVVYLQCREQADDRLRSPCADRREGTVPGDVGVCLSVEAPSLTLDQPQPLQAAKLRVADAGCLGVAWAEIGTEICLRETIRNRGFREHQAFSELKNVYICE